MSIATERSIQYLERYIKENLNTGNAKANIKKFASRIGLTEKEFDELRAGKRLLPEGQFQRLLEHCKCQYSLPFNAEEWLKKLSNWPLIGMSEPIFTLTKRTTGEAFERIQAITVQPDAVIDDSVLPIEKGDILTCDHSNGILQQWEIINLEFYANSLSRPAYHFQIEGWKSIMINEGQTQKDNIRTILGFR